MARKILKCTKCQMTFELQTEFDICPECKMGFLISEPNESIIDIFEAKYKHINKALNEPSDDFFDSGYVNEKPEFYQPEPNEIVHKHLMHRCYNMPVLPVWNLQLSFDDIDTQRFMTCTIDASQAFDVKEPKEITTDAINKMSEIFVNTFEGKM